MKTYSQKGEILPYHNGSGGTLTSGTVVKVGARVGVLTGDILNGADGEALFQGVATVPTDTGTVWADGDALWWDDTNKYFTKTKTTANVPAGTAVGAKLSGATTATVKLQQQAGPGLAAVVAANATTAAIDLTTSEALANSLQTTVNAILTSLKNAGVMATA